MASSFIFGYEHSYREEVYGSILMEHRPVLASKSLQCDASSNIGKMVQDGTIFNLMPIRTNACLLSSEISLNSIAHA